MRTARTAGRRPLIFFGVGALGLVVQITALSLLTHLAGWHYLPATLLAVSLAVLHNFGWHQRWTWSDRPAGALSARLRRLGWFAATTGVISIGGNLGLMALYAGRLGIPTVAANLATVASMSVVNFFASEYWTFRARRPRRPTSRSTAIGAALLCCLGGGSLAEAADLRPETIAAWDRYVLLTERRIDKESGDPGRVHDTEWSAADRRLLLSGGIPVVQLESHDDGGRAIEVPSGSIHHWRGAMLIPHVTLDQVLDAALHPVKQEDVIDLKVLARSVDSLRLYLRLVRDGIVTVTYDTEHDVRFARRSPTLASCQSIATRIAELENAGTGSERARPVGQDHGFLWRLNAYWRYEQVDTGVTVELESITLGRDMPMLIGPIVRPLVNRVARESLNRTLEGFRRRFPGN